LEAAKTAHKFLLPTDIQAISAEPLGPRSCIGILTIIDVKSAGKDDNCDYQSLSGRKSGLHPEGASSVLLIALTLDLPV
jgi:hypothetical protein